jgi:hypothetical protein
MPANIICQVSSPLKYLPYVDAWTRRVAIIADIYSSIEPKNLVSLRNPSTYSLQRYYTEFPALVSPLFKICLSQIVTINRALGCLFTKRGNCKGKLSIVKLGFFLLFHLSICSNYMMRDKAAQVARNLQVRDLRGIDFR